MNRGSLLLPIALVLLSLAGMMIVFMHEGERVPDVIMLLLLGAIAAIGNSAWLEWRNRRSPRGRSLPGWVLPFAGTVGGLAICAQLAIYLANSLQEQPVQWFLHVPGLTALIALFAAVHVAWRD